MKRITFILLAILLLTMPEWATIRPASAAATEQESNCLFFTETVQDGGGFSVCDNQEAKFRTPFERWGLQKIGYPISRRYVHDGFVTQAFQKAIMQWRPDGNYVALVNIFDDLHNTMRVLMTCWYAIFRRLVNSRQAGMVTFPLMR